MKNIQFIAPDTSLTAQDFISLAQRVWPGNFDPSLVQEALHRTTNITAWENQKLVGCVRILTDGYFFGTIPEILVDPACQRQGIGRRLMELAWDHSPTSLFFGAQPGKEPFFEKLGFQPGLPSFSKRKHRPEKRPPFKIIHPPP